VFGSILLSTDVLAAKTAWRHRLHDRQGTASLSQSDDSPAGLPLLISKHYSVNARLIKRILLCFSFALIALGGGICLNTDKYRTPDTASSTREAPTSVQDSIRTDLDQSEGVQTISYSTIPKKREELVWKKTQEISGEQSIESWAVRLAESGTSYEQIEQKLVEREGKEALISFRWAARSFLKEYFEFPPFWEAGTIEVPVLPQNLAKEVTQHIVSREWDEIKAKILAGTFPINSRLQNTRPTTVFMQALLTGDEDLVDWFLANGANPTGLDLRTAIAHGKNTIALKLIQAGADIHHQTIPELSNNFVVAILRNNLEMAEFLRRSGVSIRPDPVGYDALELSLKRRKPTNETIEYLRMLGFASQEIPAE